MGQGIDGVANRVEPGVIWVVGREGLGGFGAAGPVEGGRRGRVGVAELVGRGRVGWYGPAGRNVCTAQKGVRVWSKLRASNCEGKKKLEKNGGGG